MEKPVRGVLDLEADNWAAVRRAERILRVEIDVNVLSDASSLLGQGAVGLYRVPVVFLQRLQRQALAYGPLLSTSVGSPRSEVTAIPRPGQDSSNRRCESRKMGQEGRLREDSWT